MEYVLTVILTGLIAAGFPKDQTMLALALDDGAEHKAYLLLLEGECTGTSGACHHLGGEDPPVLTELPMAWSLEEDGWANLDISLSGTTSPVSKVDEILGLPGPFPQQNIQRVDFHWVPSLTMLSGDPSAELDDACFDLRQSVRDCGNGLAARLRIPFGRAGTCHLAHMPNQLPADSGACDFTSGREASRLVAIHDFVERVGGSSPVSARAVADAISITQEIKGKIGVSIASPKVTVELSPDRSTNRLTLVLMNAAVEDILSNENVYRRMVKRHHHFDHFYSLLKSEPPPRKLAPWLPHLQKERFGFVQPGPCEPYLECLDYLFVGSHVYQMSTEDIVRERAVRRAVPHNYSQCDTATYP